MAVAAGEQAGQIRVFTVGRFRIPLPIQASRVCHSPAWVAAESNCPAVAFASHPVVASSTPTIW